MSTPQTFAITVPHASSQLALGRCACPDGASLTTVGSVLVDAAGTLTAQCDGAFVAQTNAAMSWLSQAGTQVHTAAGIQIYAGGGTAPGACGAGSPADSPGASTPGATTQLAVEAALLGASLSRLALQGPSVGMAASAASGLAGLVGGTDIEQRAVNEIKMVAGLMITKSAGVGFDYRTLNKFGVTAGAMTSFTTTVWGAFCLLKFEVKAGYAVKAKTRVVKVEGKTTATLDAKAALKIISPKIDYVSKLEVTKTLTVDKKTTVNSLEVKKNSTLDGTLTVNKNMVLEMNLTVVKNLDAKAKAEVGKKTTAKGAASVSKKTQVA